MRKSNLFKYLATTALVLNLNANEIYTVDDLIIKSFENSPNLQISKANYEASQSRYDSAFSGYLPSVNFYATAGKTGISDTFGGSGDMLNDTLLLGKLSAKQIIYDFGATGGNVDSSKYSSLSFNMQNLEDITNKKREIKEAYYHVLNALALIRVQEENVKLNKAQLYRSKKYFEAGIRTKIDVSDAKVSLIQAKLDLKKAQYQLKLAYADLDEKAGFTELERKYSVYTQELNLSSLFASLSHYEFNLRESIVYAYEHRAVLKKQEAEVQSSLAQESQVSAGYYPSLYLLADYTKQSVDTFKQFVPEDKWQASFNLEWNIYQGGDTNAKNQEKKINTAIANSAVIAVQLRIKKETTRAFLNLHQSRDSVELSQSLVEVSSEKFDQASKRYEHGLSDYIELQQARQGYIDAKASLIIDYYNYYISVAYLDSAIGR